MKILMSFVSSFFVALATIFIVMGVFTLFEPHALKPWAAIGMAAGIATANAIRTWKTPSLHVFAALVGCLVALGDMVGTWLSSG